ncbi:MAG: hypothetical protein FJX76_18065, partial [Armatimonadetes bacterium]|nr:hypothetical protein [Armatimonadota bacterium]
MPLRVSHQALFDRTAFQIMQGYDRYTSQQGLVASGKAFLQASDNPTEAVQALQGRQMINVNEQYQKSLTLANGWVTYTDQNLDTVIKGLQDAR